MRIQELILEMTLEEKVAQLSCVEAKDLVDDNNRFCPEKAQGYLKDGIGHVAGIAYTLAIGPEDAARLSNAIQDWLLSNTRMGIPAIFHEECLSGLASKGSAAYPHPIGLGSMWEPELVYQMAEIIKTHVRAVGAHQALSPVLDLYYDPRWGRCEETYGEDAYLVAVNAAAFIKGLQGDDPSSGVVATAKHFAGHGYSEGGRNCAPIHIGRREFRETVLFPFEAAVKEAGVKSIMPAYHDVDGIPCTGSKELLTGVLRDEWGFDGVTVSDYFAVERLCSHHFTAADKKQAAIQALEAGIDVELPFRDCYGDFLIEAVKDGHIDIAFIDRAVTRILKQKQEQGIFDRRPADPSGAKAVFSDTANRELALLMAKKSVVLLKNENNLLPLKKDKIRSIAVIGPNAASKRNLLGDYSYISMNAHFGDGIDIEDSVEAVMGREIVSVLQGVKDKLGPAADINYARGCDLMDYSTAGFAEAVEAVKNSELAIVVAGDKAAMFEGGTSGENIDRSDITLFGRQEELIKAVAGVGKPVVLVLVNGKPLDISGVADKVGAIVEAWLPGEQGGAAIADVIFGDYNPGAKLSVTMLNGFGQFPLRYGIKSASCKDYLEKPARPLFPFGYGLSYTRFVYDNLCISPLSDGENEGVCISFELANAGAMDGEEVAQLYIRDEIASVARPSMELKGFKRIFLKAGEKQRLEFRLYYDQLAFYNREMKLVVEPGAISVMVGGASDDIRLKSKFEITGQKREPEGNRKFFSECTVKSL